MAGGVPFGIIASAVIDGLSSTPGTVGLIGSFHGPGIGLPPASGLVTGVWYWRDEKTPPNTSLTAAQPIAAQVVAPPGTAAIRNCSPWPAAVTPGGNAKPAKPVEGRAAQPRTHRETYFGRWIRTPVYDRRELAAGMQFQGPAIIEQVDTTTVIEPDMVARVDAYQNILVEMA